MSVVVNVVSSAVAVLDAIINFADQFRKRLISKLIK